MFNRLEKRLKTTTVFDMQLIKATIFFFMLWFVSMIAIYFPRSFNWLSQMRWVWFVLFLLFLIKPFWKFWLSKGVKEEEKLKKSKKTRR